MKSKLKKIIIWVCAVLAVIGAVLFGLYKIFVTPQRIVMLTMMNVQDDLEQSFEYMWDSDYEIIKDYFKDGGNMEMNLVLSDAPILNDMPVNIEVNKDKSCSVTEVGLYDKFNFELYRDDSEVYINTPLFGGGFKLPVKSFGAEWNKSIFKDIVKVSPDYGAKEIARDFMTGNYDAENFLKSKGKELLNAVNDINVTKNGKSKVTVSGNEKKADEYSVKLTKETYDRFAEILMSYMFSTGYGSGLVSDLASSGGITEDDVKNSIKSELDKYSYERDVTLKIVNMTLREIVITKDDGNKTTIAFEGEKNAFDIIKYYINDNELDALLRLKSRVGRNVTDSISVGDKILLSLEMKGSGFELNADTDNINLIIQANGKKGYDDVIMFENFELEAQGLLKLSGTLKISDEYDKDFSFNKTGEYVNLLAVTQEDWEAVSKTLTDSLKILSDKK